MTRLGAGVGRLADTLALRLFVLIWVALVASHLVAYVVVHQWAMPSPGAAPGPGAETGSGVGQGAGPRAGPQENTWPRPDVGSIRGAEQGPDSTRGLGATPPPRPGSPPRDQGPPRERPPLPTFPSLPPTPGLGGAPANASGSSPPGALPTGVLLLDYGLRLIVIGLAAWWGSRWLARPVARLVSAAQALGPALAAGRSPPPLDEGEGTREVRSAAGVFNDMARRIQRQFRERGLMIAAISHDLRTPLTRMRLRVETAEVPDRLRERCTSDLQEMNALIDTVLEVFREPGDGVRARQRTDITALVQALVDDRAEQGAKVSLSGPTVIASTDALMLRRVLGNLIDNALRYAGQAEVQIEQGAGPAATEVRVAVLDRGPGIPADRLEAVLQPFVRVEGSRNPNTGGTGLGLYIARELVTRLGGRLALRNRSDGGLQAEVVLPIS